MPSEETAQPLSEEINSALASVWKKHAAARPTDGTTEIRGNVITCVFPNAVRDFEQGPEVEEDQEATDLKGRVLLYRRDATAAVSRSTHCRVAALISKHD